MSAFLKSLFLIVVAISHLPALASEPLEFEKGDKVVILGNTLAERMQYFNFFETRLHHRFPNHELTVRNLGWSADSIGERLRSQDFQDHGHTLIDHQPNVIIAMVGFNESFAGEAGLADFEMQLAEFIRDLKKLKYPSTTYSRGSYEPKLQDKSGEPAHEVEVVLLTPIANEDLPERGIHAGTQNNSRLRLYSESMQKIAAAEGVQCVDIFTPTLQAMEEAATPWTINGIHLNETGYQRLSEILEEQLFGTASPWDSEFEALRKEVAEKNQQFFYDYRAVNGYYIYGGRKNPFGVINFPAEFAKLREMTQRRDKRIWAVAQGASISRDIDDSEAGVLAEIQTNYTNEISISSPEEAAQSLFLSEGLKIELWASEVEFPNLQNPVQFTFDSQGRMYVTTMPSYPMVLPGERANDKVLILSDEDRDGKADTEIVFAKGLYLPTGIELAHGGAYVAQQPNLMFLKDMDQDDIADEYQLRLHGFDSADSHHAISAFELGPGGALYFQEGTFHHSQVETSYGPQQVANSAVFRYEPIREKLDVFVSYDFANPWGHCFDQWGQNFVADASGGANYVGAAFSGDLIHPRKHPVMKEFLVKQWRPTCGCEIVSSRQFPEEMQGDYLLNNCIGFQGVLRYRFEEEGSGFSARPAEPLFRSADPSFRPVDLQFGPDGALYVLDWFNPLVGHMQHSLRDPNRDTQHGRIWRITYAGRPLLEVQDLAAMTTPELLDQLQQPEDRTRFRTRRELGQRDKQEVISAIDTLVAHTSEETISGQKLLLECLWVKQHHDAIDETLLDRVLATSDGRVRAAAVRVLCYWRDRIDDPLSKLQLAIHDEHPRVRLEVLRALSFFHDERALEIAVESLIYEQDVYLEYALQETLETLQNRIDSAR
ncbi:PVC-type heme-binding CxxCH protein [Thalassoglobus sp. JC818]|uniref:PVC-type heme-binding CxxCH protein n=1 Tax=Thalassoglobus sp. JC818 TaxID=3232136 RepID=UPI00345B0B90